MIVVLMSAASAIPSLWVSEIRPAQCDIACALVAKDSVASLVLRILSTMASITSPRLAAMMSFATALSWSVTSRMEEDTSCQESTASPMAEVWVVM